MFWEGFSIHSFPVRLETMVIFSFFLAQSHSCSYEHQDHEKTVQVTPNQICHTYISELMITHLVNHYKHQLLWASVCTSVCFNIVESTSMKGQPFKAVLKAYHT